MQVAVIDIGTNTVLLLVARFDQAGNLSPLVYEQRVPRLGKGVDAAKTLDPDSIERVVAVLLEYKNLLSRFTPKATVVCSTSAVRESANRDEFIQRVRHATGFSVEVLSGEDEAYWTFRGAVSGASGYGRFTVLDIGGGSTEITTGTSAEIQQSISLDIGSVRLSERLFAHDPPTALELESTIEVVEDELTRARGFPFSGSKLIGVAGTATTLALLAQGLQDFQVEAVTNFRLTRDAVENLFRTLREMPSSEIRALSSVLEGRADIINAGTLILREVMHHYGFDEMIVSERGVRYGLAMREWEKSRGRERT